MTCHSPLVEHNTDRADAADLVLFEDPKWLSAEFVGIMTSSGFGDRVIVSTLHPLPAGNTERRGGRRMLGGAREVCAAALRSRVRSPPFD